MVFYRQWVTQGIQTKEILDLGSYSFQVTCESSHLTAFAAIVDIAQVRSTRMVLNYYTNIFPYIHRKMRCMSSLKLDILVVESWLDVH